MSTQLFPTDSPLAPDELIGRSGDVGRAAQSLQGGENIVLVGPRRTGKTSVGDAAIAACARAGCYVATVDLFLLGDAASLANELSLTVLANRSVPARADLGEDLELTLAPARADRDPARALRVAFELPQRIASADGRRVVLFLDEFQELASGRFGDPDAVTKQLRSALQRSRDVSTLFSGSIAHVMRDLFGPSERALSQFGSYVELDPIDPSEWQTGLGQRFKQATISAPADPLQRIIEYGEGHPRSTMLIAQQTHGALLERGASDLTDASVDAGLEGAMRADRLRHQQTLEQIHGCGRFAQRVAERVARGEAPYTGIAPEQARRTLSALTTLGVTAPGEHRGEWLITEPLLRRYLAQPVQPPPRAARGPAS